MYENSVYKATVLDRRWPRLPTARSLAVTKVPRNSFHENGFLRVLLWRRLLAFFLNDEVQGKRGILITPFPFCLSSAFLLILQF